MVLFGTLIDGAGIIVGSVLGLFLTRIPERFKETVMHGIGLTVIFIGLQMALKTDMLVVVLLSLLTGAIIGEYCQLEEKLNGLGNWIGSKFTTPPGSAISVSQGFVTASLIFVIGALSIVGALDSGLRGDHSVLITKGMIDGFAALVLTSTLGYGVLFSVVPVVIYEGIIALLATQIDKFVPEHFLDGAIIQLTAVGGLLIVAIGLNLLKLTQIRVGNLMPALITVIVIFYIQQLWVG